MKDFVETFSYSQNPIQDSLSFLKGYNSVKIFIDDLNIKKEVYEIFGQENKNVQIYNLHTKTKQFLDELEYTGEDIVVAIGSGELLDCVKYYASSFDLMVVGVLVGEFYDYNLSKFSLIYDGAFYDFYSSVSPAAFFIKSDMNSKEMDAYARAKSIEFFDFLCNEVLLQDKVNNDAKQFFKNTILELRLENYTMKSIVKAFLRLGMAMTFFDTTKLFLFGYFDVFNFLYACHDERKCQNASVIISKSYLLGFKYKIKERGYNLNIKINKVAKFLKLPAFCVMQKLKLLDKNIIVKNEIVKINAYKEFLRDQLLRNILPLKNYTLDKKYIKVINYAALFSNRRTLLKILTESGMIGV